MIKLFLVLISLTYTNILLAESYDYEKQNWTFFNESNKKSKEITAYASTKTDSKKRTFETKLTVIDNGKLLEVTRFKIYNESGSWILQNQDPKKDHKVKLEMKGKWPFKGYSADHQFKDGSRQKINHKRTASGSQDTILYYNKEGKYAGKLEVKGTNISKSVYEGFIKKY